jgi:hypothetical protein
MSRRGDREMLMDTLKEKNTHRPDLSVGTPVHNVPADTYGLIVAELEPITTPGPDSTFRYRDPIPHDIVERRFLVLYPDSAPIITGGSFLEAVPLEAQSVVEALRK